MNRAVVIGVGTALLVIGLAGLGLEQTGVIFPRSSERRPAVQPPGPAAAAEGLPSQPAEANRTVKQPESTPCPPAAPRASLARRFPANREALPRKLSVARAVKRARPRGSGNLAGLKKLRGYAVAVHGAPSDRAASSPRFARGPRLASVGTGPARRTGMRFANSAPRPLVIRFTFDPDRDRPFSVASVHLGDRVRVDIRQVGPVNRRVYFTFSRGLDSRRGALLELRTMGSFEGPLYFRRPGHYVIRVRIYPDNRWRIMPRSFV